MHKNLSSLHNGIAQQFETMLSEMSSQKQLLTEIEENMLKVICNVGNVAHERMPDTLICGLVAYNLSD